MHRTQIYLDDAQTAQLDARAAAEGSSRSTVIRRAVDVYLAQEDKDATAWREQWGQAVEKSAGRAPYLQEGSDFVEDVRRADADRLNKLTS
ncbi:MAG TPA: CopG family transcriptional regulator [Solirubrobacterales bacterium]|nr:CopG family transcriptional regulator [Solirubrobacterales bacterium]